MCPYLTAYQYWSRPERSAPNTQPHLEIQDPNNGNGVWALISSALDTAMWDYLEVERVVLLRKHLGNLGMINMTFD
jgi:hypothetical protein